MGPRTPHTPGSFNFEINVLRKLNEISSAPLPVGAATEAKQDSQITQETAINTALGSNETGTTLRGRIKTWYDAAIAFFSAITTIIVSGKLNVRAAETDAALVLLNNPMYALYIDDDDAEVLIGTINVNATTGAVTRVFRQVSNLAVKVPVSSVTLFDQAVNNSTYQIMTPVELTITQLTTTGDSDELFAEGKTGSFVYNFMKNGGTSAIVSIEGSNDGSLWVNLASSASLVVDTTLALTWSVPYKHLRAFFTQTGAGSTLDGTFYAK